MKYPKLLCPTIILALAIGCTARAQDFTSTSRVADINPGGAGSFPSNFVAFNGALYFSAYTLEAGRELWRYDGANVIMVTNINDQTHVDEFGTEIGNDSAPTWFTLFNGALYFSAYDQRRGGELWRYDGTHAVRVADINPDRDDMLKLIQNSSWPYELTVMGNALYFGADSAASLIPGPGGFPIPNYELWRYDGVRATIVTNIHPNFGTNHSSYPNHLKVFNNALYFMADDGLNGYELWKHAASGTVLLANINPGGADSSSFPKFFTPFRNQLYFQAYDNVHGYELWRTDGAATSLVTNLNPTGSSFPEHFTVFKDALYFAASDGTTGFELWKYDGTAASLVADLNPYGDSTPQNLTVFQDNLCFAANDGVHGFELWRFDGTSLSLVADLNLTGDSFPEEFTVWNNRLYFTATNDVSGYELWTFDGQRPSMVADINPGPPSSFPFYPTVFGSELCFSANDGYFSDWELWSTQVIPFHITRIEQLGPGVRLTWTTMGGTTNIVQTTDNLAEPFRDLSSRLLIQGTGQSTTNYLDTTTAGASRFYRILQP